MNRIDSSNKFKLIAKAEYRGIKLRKDTAVLLFKIREIISL